ncbi:MAG: lactate utilization protein [Desulfobacter sp.]|nr:MAG: lactate utilization protein [Desulfobacter sp.]
MMKALSRTFSEKANLVSARVYPVPTLGAAFDKAVDICLAKAPLEPQMENPEPLGAKAHGVRIMAAPNLDERGFDSLAEKCESAGTISLVREGLRRYPGGIDVGLTLADYGIAETGTLVLDSASEETRLASMLSEIHVAVLPLSKLRSTALEMADELNGMIQDSGTYTAFITGASRTADIERVLALGVHGPLELHIMLVEED